MKQRQELMDMREKVYRFMQGRYGMDAFSGFLIGAGLLTAVLNAFFGSRILTVLSWAFVIFAYSRIFSKNRGRCIAQNLWFYNHTKAVREFVQKERGRMRVRKTHHIYTCKKCGQKIRIPKGKGRIMVTCPKCRNEFPKRS